MTVKELVPGTGPTCECGHSRSRHKTTSLKPLETTGACLMFGCDCWAYVARRVCVSCGGLGIRFDAPPRVVQALTAVGVEVNRFEFVELNEPRGPRCRAVIAGTWTARVALDRPGVEAVYQLESRLNRPEWDVADDARALADLMLDAGQWLCPFCYGHGVRRQETWR